MKRDTTSVCGGNLYHKEKKQGTWKTETRFRIWGFYTEYEFSGNFSSGLHCCFTVHSLQPKWHIKGSKAKTHIGLKPRRSAIKWRDHPATTVKISSLKILKQKSEKSISAHGKSFDSKITQLFWHAKPVMDWKQPLSERLVVDFRREANHHEVTHRIQCLR